MRAQRDTVHPTSRRASPARRNSPALDSCEPTWRNASPGDITETTPPGAGRPRGWRHRVCRPKRLPRGVGDLQADGAVGTTAGIRTVWDDRPCHRQRLRRHRSAPGHPGRPPHAKEPRTMRTGRAGPAAAAARRRAVRGPPPGRPRRVIRGMRPPAGLARPPAGFGEEGGRAGARTCARGRPWGNLTLVRATARVRTSLLLSRRGGA